MREQSNRYPLTVPLKDNERISFVYVTEIVGDSNQTLGPILTKFCSKILRRNTSVMVDWANRFKMATNLNILENKMDWTAYYFIQPNPIKSHQTKSGKNYTNLTFKLTILQKWSLIKIPMIDTAESGRSFVQATCIRPWCLDSVPTTPRTWWEHFNTVLLCHCPLYWPKNNYYNCNIIINLNTIMNNTFHSSFQP